MVLMANMEMESSIVGDRCRNHELEQGLLMKSKFYSIDDDDSSPLVLQPSGGGRLSVGGGDCDLVPIKHTVSKFDTLVGVAIKYGVEVADIKRMNNLTTDQQMFALKVLQIPLPGRHPPSPIVSNGTNGSQSTPVQSGHSDLLNSIKLLKLSSSSQHNVSPTRNNLPGYYGHKPNDQNRALESFEMAVYREGSHDHCSKSLVNGLSKKVEPLVTNDKDNGSDNCLEKFVRRRKSEVELNNTEIQVKRGSLPKQKVGSRASNENETSLQNLFPLAPKETLMVETSTGVRKSSSTLGFDESSNINQGISSSSSIWPTSILKLTVDFQALSTAAIAIPMFDGLPIPSSGRKNKAALD